MNKIPNQPVKLNWVLSRFRKLTAVSALPLVALPALVLLATEALPLAAATFTLLLMVLLLVALTLVLLVALVISLPSAAAVAPGALRMTPTKAPGTLTNTISALVPIIWLPVRLKILTAVDVLPDVADPA